VPPGWGEPLYDKLDADLAHALMGLNAVKGVEIGDGMEAARQKAPSTATKSLRGFLSNHAGGVLGGISSGQAVVAHIAIKPTSSMRLPGRSIDRNGQPIEVVTHAATILRRHPRDPIAEALMAIVLMDHALRHRAQCGDVELGTMRVPGAT